MDKQMIADNLESVRERIKSAAGDRTVTLIAVTKTVDVQSINAAIELGVTDIGENKVQELLGKLDTLLPSKRHLIGGLQTNKVKQIVSKVDCIHSVDRIELATAINKYAERLQSPTDVLVQVNIALEQSKGGVPPGDLFALLDGMSSLEHIMVRGLMCIPPNDPSAAQGYFAELRELQERAKARFWGANFDLCELSMGMSADFEAAIREGATMVRVGSAIFGQRFYN